ncbi:MAG: FliI/YscN family ATPase [Deltaproteobacteria bacterium]|nr:FliI/YscN family ATPase [Deltaproteobacteria bacterium]
MENIPNIHKSAGRILSVKGYTVISDIQNVRIGDIIEVVQKDEQLTGEIIGFEENRSIIMMHSDTVGLRQGSILRVRTNSQRVLVGHGLIGKVIDGFGKIISGGGMISGEGVELLNQPPHPLTRRKINSIFETGIKTIDGLLTLGKGQRVGLFAGSGVGKSTLLGNITKFAKADIIVVNLIGERGREVKEFIEDVLGEEGMKRSILIISTSDQSPLLRVRSAYVATAIAEYFRELGKDVLLLMDSLTRFARAQRELGLSIGELPVRNGYPPSVFLKLAKLLERSGTSSKGSITAIYTVLVQGDDMQEIIADEIRGILDGHIVLRREIAAAGIYPAIDVLHSVSRVMNNLISEEHKLLAQQIREMMAIYEKNREIISLGMYTRGTNKKLDEAVDKMDRIYSFLKQGSNVSPLCETINEMKEIVCD